MNVEVYGMEVGEPLPDGAVPLGALVCTKVMMPDGVVHYQVRTTEDLPLVESLGMANHAALLIGETILHPQ